MPLSTSVLTAHKTILTAAVLSLAGLIVGGSMVIQYYPALSGRGLLSLAERGFFSLEFALGEDGGLRHMAAAALSDTAARETTAIRTGAQSIPVLNYHGILTFSDGSDINLTQEQFKDQMFALKRAGYTAITPAELLAWKRGEKELPTKSVMLTFDDGRADSFYNGDPILAATGFNATMYVISHYAFEALTGSYYLSARELERMHKTGRWTIEAHTEDGHGFIAGGPNGNGNFFSTYAWLPDKGRAETSDEYLLRAENDLATVKQKIEGLLGTSVVSFAFPFGDIGQNRPDMREFTPRLVAAAHALYPLLMVQEHPEMHFSHTYPEPEKNVQGFIIKRIDAGQIKDADELLTILERGAAKTLPYREDFRKNDWVRVWGTLALDENAKTLHIAALPAQSGASIILDGTAHWEDYHVTAQVAPPNPSGTVVWLRFVDDSNNAACNFGDEFTHVEQTVNGEKRVIKGVRRPDIIPDGPYTVEAEVRGRRVICRLNGETLVDTDFLDPSLLRGGVGFKTWSETLGIAELTLSSVAIEPL